MLLISGPFDSKRNFNDFDQNERRRPQMTVKPSTVLNGGRITIEDAYPLPPIGVNPVRKPMGDDMDSYFDPQDEVVAERPSITEKNVFKDNVEGTISLTPDGKRLRRKTRRQTTPAPSFETTTMATTTPAPVPTTKYVFTTTPATTIRVVPDFFAQNKPQIGTFNQKDEFDNYWSGDIGVKGHYSHFYKA